MPLQTFRRYIILDSIELDPEEQEIVDAFEREELTPISNMEQELKLHQTYAAETFKKDKRITIRISGRDLDGLRKKAIVEGLAYQTLISSVLHKYVTGRLAEVAPAG